MIKKELIIKATFLTYVATHALIIRLESIMLQNLLIIIFGISPISADYPHLYDFWVCFMLTFYIYNCTFCIRMIIIGIKFKLQEQLQYKSFIKCTKLMSVHQFVAILIVT